MVRVCAVVRNGNVRPASTWDDDDALVVDRRCRRRRCNRRCCRDAEHRTLRARARALMRKCVRNILQYTCVVSGVYVCGMPECVYLLVVHAGREHRSKTQMTARNAVHATMCKISLVWSDAR